MRFLYIYFFFLLTYSSYSQELPPILNFSTKDYLAGNQNWMIAQDEEEDIYAANNAGLLSFDGERWQLHQLPEGSFIRSIAVADDKIFSGAYMDFGYWQKDETGKLNYTSLKDLVDTPFIDGEQFWHIEAVNNYVVFQSLSRLYSYNIKTNKVVLLPTTNTITNLFKLNNKIYYQVADEGLYVIENGQDRIYISNAELNNQIVVGFFEYKNTRYLITRTNQIYRIEGEKLKEYHFENLDLASDESIFVAELTTNSTLALGTIGNGLKLYDLEDKTLTHFRQPSILNNTVLSLFTDSHGNLWSGLDNGISLVNLNSSVKIFSDTFGEIGTVYCSFRNNDILYLGTNQGLYAKTIASQEDFKLISKTSGQVWSIQKINNHLLVGHDKGTFLIEKFQAQPIFEQTGTWEVKAYKNGLLQGHYNGMSYAEINNGEIQQFQRFTNYDLSSRNLVIDSLENQVWVGHDHKGIYKLNVNESAKTIDVVDNYSLPTQEGTGLSVFKFYNELYVSTAKLIYQYNSSTNSFEKAERFNSLFKGHQRITGVSKVIDGNTWWSFGQENIFQIAKDALQDDYVLNTITIPNSLRGIATSFENISAIDNNKFLIGSNLGYITFQLPFRSPEVSELKINNIAIANKGENYSNLAINANDVEIPFKDNFIRFSYTIPHYNLLSDVEYSTMLVGYDDHWSNWNTTGKTSFKNLPYGSYIFKVKGNLNGKETAVEEYQFIIAKPWYVSTLAIIIYAIIFLLIIYLTNRFYNNYYKKEQNKIIAENKKRLELQEITAQREIVTLKNQQLETEVASKNRELAASTMNIIRKNEFLSELKQKLNKANTNEDVEEVISIINKNIAEKDNWKLFKEAFDNADKDFLQSVKEKHPNLTSNDLKLCAYLRLNLSSKEIAPMLNISVRSVEIKRYRLRKKMDLAHEEGLVEYILTF